MSVSSHGVAHWRPQRYRSDNALHHGQKSVETKSTATGLWLKTWSLTESEHVLYVCLIFVCFVRSRASTMTLALRHQSIVLVLALVGKYVRLVTEILTKGLLDHHTFL